MLQKLKKQCQKLHLYRTPLTRRFSPQSQSDVMSHVRKKAKLWRSIGSGSFKESSTTSSSQMPQGSSLSLGQVCALLPGLLPLAMLDLVLAVALGVGQHRARNR
eukprot:933414_1